MKVYLVTSPDDNIEDDVHGIYSTPEKAELAKDLFCASEVVEFELDELPECPADKRPYRAECDWGNADSRDNKTECHRISIERGGYGSLSVGSWVFFGWNNGAYRLIVNDLFESEDAALSFLASEIDKVKSSDELIRDVNLDARGSSGGKRSSYDCGKTWTAK